MYSEYLAIQAGFLFRQESTAEVNISTLDADSDISSPSFIWFCRISGNRDRFRGTRSQFINASPVSNTTPWSLMPLEIRPKLCTTRDAMVLRVLLSMFNHSRWNRSSGPAPDGRSSITITRQVSPGRSIPSYRAVRISFVGGARFTEIVKMFRNSLSGRRCYFVPTVASSITGNKNERLLVSNYVNSGTYVFPIFHPSRHGWDNYHPFAFSGCCLWRYKLLWHTTKSTGECILGA